MKLFKKKAKTDEKSKLTAYGDEEYPVDHQLREARIGLIAVRNYIVARENAGDILLDQSLVDLQQISVRMLHDLDKLEEVLNMKDPSRDEVDKLLTTRMESGGFGEAGTVPSEDQDY